MMLNDFIKDLQALKKKFGNLPVKRQDGSGDVPVGSVCCYTEEGDAPETREEAAEIYIH